MIIYSQHEKKEKEKDCVITETDEKIINIDQSEITYRIEKVFLYSIIIICIKKYFKYWDYYHIAKKLQKMKHMYRNTNVQKITKQFNVYKMIKKDM